MPISSNDKETKILVRTLIKNIGYEAFDLGKLDKVLWQEPEGPFYNKALSFSEAEKIWNTIN